MPLTLEIKRQLSTRSERVKAVDFHPTEPWILAALYTGHLCIWNSQTQTMIKSVEASSLPIRAAKFIPRKQWVVCGGDDMLIRVFNYNTMQKIAEFEAHSDYIRGIAVHPTQPYILSSSDDLLIKLWDWEKNWNCQQVYEGHIHYVMAVEWNPKDTSTFASGSLDRTVKVWGLQSPRPHFSLEGHAAGVNCIGYYRGGDRPYLVSGSDDQTVKVWDYQTKACVATLTGHQHNVSAVVFHPQLPVIISGSEDGTVRFWHGNTYKWESTLNYRMDRVWALSVVKSSNAVGIGYDEGTVMISLGHEEPVASMDHNGKVVFANNTEMRLGDIRKSEGGFEDGEAIEVPTKDLENCEVYPQTIQHSPNDRLVAVCGDGEFIIYTALRMKSTSFGRGLEFVWAANSRNYAAREGSKLIQVYQNGKEFRRFQPRFAADRIFGGPLLGVRSGEFIDFVDWEECRTIRRIEVVPQEVYWSETGEVCVLACETEFYVLRYNKPLVERHIAKDSPSLASEHGVDGAFEVEAQVDECVRTACFIGDCFIYTASHPKHGGNPKLQYYVGGSGGEEDGDDGSGGGGGGGGEAAPITLAHLSRPMYLLGYLPKLNRVFLMDKNRQIISFELLLSVLVYQTAVVRRDWDAARKALRRIPETHLNRVAQFLEGQGFHKMALRVSRDPEHQFELAVHLGELELARRILLRQQRRKKSDHPSVGGEEVEETTGEEGEEEAAEGAEDVDSSALTSSQEALWKRLGDLALNEALDLVLAEECYRRAGDLNSLLLLHSSTGDAAGLREVGKLARDGQQWNTAFLALLLTGATEDCVELLLETGRPAEAALFCRTYCPSRLPDTVRKWKTALIQDAKYKTAQSIADPDDYPEMFPDLDTGIQIEAWLKAARASFDALTAEQYQSLRTRDLFTELQEGGLDAVEVEQREAPEILFQATEEHTEASAAEEEEEEEELERADAVDDVAAMMMEDDSGLVAEEEDVNVDEDFLPQEQQPRPQQQESKEQRDSPNFSSPSTIMVPEQLGEEDDVSAATGGAERAADDEAEEEDAEAEADAADTSPLSRSILGDDSPQRRQDDAAAFTGFDEDDFGFGEETTPRKQQPPSSSPSASPLAARTPSRTVATPVSSQRGAVDSLSPSMATTLMSGGDGDAEEVDIDFDSFGNAAQQQQRQTVRSPVSAVSSPATASPDRSPREDSSAASDGSPAASAAGGLKAEKSSSPSASGWSSPLAEKTKMKSKKTSDDLADLEADLADLDSSIMALDEWDNF